MMWFRYWLNHQPKAFRNVNRFEYLIATWPARIWCRLVRNKH